MEETMALRYMLRSPNTPGGVLFGRQVAVYEAGVMTLHLLSQIEAEEEMI
jgi:hypothetical protein